MIDYFVILPSSTQWISGQTECYCRKNNSCILSTVIVHRQPANTDSYKAIILLEIEVLDYHSLR